MTATAAQVSYEDLYARWERGNWSATELDFSRDCEDWAAACGHRLRRVATSCSCSSR